MTSKIIDLGFVGDIARCPKCGSRVDGEFYKYIAGSPGLNEYRSDWPGCGTKLRVRGDNWFVGYPDFQWVSPNGKWAVMGLFDGPVLDFDDAVAHIELASPEGDNAVPIVILRDGSIVWGYDEDYRRSDYPEGVARECERRLRQRYAELVGSKQTRSGSARSDMSKLAVDLTDWYRDFDTYDFKDAYDSWEDAYRKTLAGLSDPSYVSAVIGFLEEVDDIDYDDSLEARRMDLIGRLRRLEGGSASTRAKRGSKPRSPTSRRSKPAGSGPKVRKGSSKGARR